MLGYLSDFGIIFGEIQRIEAVHVSDFGTWRIREEL